MLPRNSCCPEMEMKLPRNGNEAVQLMLFGQKTTFQLHLDRKQHVGFISVGQKTVNYLTASNRENNYTAGSLKTEDS
jgi:hypothetical protein